MKIRGEHVLLVARMHFLDFSYLQKWTILGIIIGLAASASAAAFSLSTTFLTSLFLEAGAGYAPPSPERATPTGFWLTGHGCFR